MTTDIENLQDYAEALQAVSNAASDQDVDFRSNVPSGTVLGETQMEPGAKTVWTKRDSGQRIGDKKLPDRVPLWDIQAGGVGQPSMVPPTIALQRMNRNPGRFFTKKPDGAELIPIDERCERCPHKAFYTEYDIEAHRQIFHPREWEIDERRAERQREDTRYAQMQTLIETLIQQNGGAASGSFVCEICGKEAKNQLGLNSHMRSHNNE